MTKRLAVFTQVYRIQQMGFFLVQIIATDISGTKFFAPPSD